MTRANVRTLRVLPYQEQWRMAWDNEWFHIRLDNHALVVFQAVDQPSYQYLACPLDVPNRSEIVTDRLTGDADVEAALATAELKKHVYPIRYDWDPEGYRSGSHPLAHLHFGVDNNIRIGLARAMSPLAFLYFVLRQEFPENWTQLLSSNLGSKAQSVVRHSLTKIDAAYYQRLDQCELYLE